MTSPGYSRSNRKQPSLTSEQKPGLLALNRRTLLAGTAAGAAAGALGHFAPFAAPQPLIARAQEVQQGGTLTYGVSFDVDGTLDPQVTNYDSTIRIMLNVCEPLIWMPTATEFVPGLAESWEVSDDGLTYTFTLKEGVTFHDGTPFNAEAVQFTFDRVVEGRNLTAAGEEVDPEAVIAPGQGFNQIDAYDHAEIVDDYTINLVLSRPFGPFLSGLNGYLGIVSPTAVQEMGLAEFGRKPVGTGPFMVQEWVEQDHVTLAKNPDYNWGSSFFEHTGAAYLDEMIYKFIPDDAVRTGTLLSGESQYIDSIDPLQLADLQENPEIVIIQQGQPGTGYILLFNLARTESPQADVMVRRALSYALDKEAMNQAVWGGIFSPASSPLMKPTLGYEPKTEEVYTYDPATANTMLDEAGWALNGEIREQDGQPLTLYWPTQDRPNDRAMSTFVQGAFREVGVDVVVEPMEQGAYSERQEAGDYDLSFLWFSYADPDVLRTLFFSENIGNFNYANYSNPEVDQLLLDAAAATDTEVRQEIYSRIQLLMLDDAVTIPLGDSITYNAKRANLEGDFLDFLASYVWMNDAHFTG
ncbi:MAG: ABC transporter substrate-binding protein [Thermomicrobiales bacterium]